MHSRFTPGCGLSKCDAGTALSCQFRTHAPQQITSLFHYLIGACDQLGLYLLHDRDTKYTQSF
jgi:hypothetical protein